MVKNEMHDEQVYELEADGKTMSAVVPSNENKALGNVSKTYAYEITEDRKETLVSYGNDPYEVHATVTIPRRNKVVTFVGKGKSFEEAHKMIEVDVRREVSFWRFCIGVNRNEDRFPSTPIPYEKQRNPQLYHGGESDVTRATAPVTGNTHPFRHAG